MPFDKNRKYNPTWNHKSVEQAAIIRGRYEELEKAEKIKFDLACAPFLQLKNVGRIGAMEVVFALMDYLEDKWRREDGH